MCFYVLKKQTQINEQSQMPVRVRVKQAPWGCDNADRINTANIQMDIGKSNIKPFCESKKRLMGTGSNLTFCVSSV